MKQARVIGAGLSGLATAWCLADRGFSVEIVDAASRPGGLIHTVQTPQGLVERAANAFVWNETTARWFQTLGIDPIFASDRSRRRFIFRDGRPRRWPLNPGESAVMAARLAGSWARRSLPPRGDESVATWSDRVLGRPATRWLVSPALQGIYASPSERLSAQAIFGGMFGRGGRAHAMTAAPNTANEPAARSRVAGRGRLAAPQGGMGEFIERLHARLCDRGASFRFGEAVAALDASIPTVVCTDARAAAGLIHPFAPALGAAVQSIATTSMLTVTAFFPRQPDDLHGFGVLFPRECGIDALGVLFNADIFAARGDCRSETWIYGEHRPAAPSVAAEDIAVLLRDRERLSGRTEEPIATYGTWVGNAGDRPAPVGGRQSAAGIPVYGPPVLAAQERLAALPPWLAVCGNYLGRLGVAKLLVVAEEAAIRIAAAAPRE